MGNLYLPGDETDWKVGSLDRFKHKIAWIIDDQVTWKIRGTDVPKIEVRKFIEQSCTGDVYVVDDYESVICSTEQFAVGPRRNIKWLVFSFEYEPDLAMFILKFGESTLHPISETTIYTGGLAQRVVYKPVKYITMAKKHNEEQCNA